MASYQEIEARLVGVENALMFLMKSLRVKQMVGSPLDPNPIVRELDMFSFYREQLAAGLLETIKTEEPTNDTASDEPVNG